MSTKKTTRYYRRPTKIKILNQTYKIEWVASSDNHGACDPDKCIIQLTKGYPSKVIATTLLHELIHAINFAMGVTDSTSEEETTQRLETDCLPCGETTLNYLSGSINNLHDESLTNRR